jgi:hypothetical protein
VQSLGVVIIVQLAKSEEFKAQANKLFQDNHVKEAMELYILALDLNPSNHILFANRAFCHIKLENYGWFPHFRPHLADCQAHNLSLQHFAWAVHAWNITSRVFKQL